MGSASFSKFTLRTEWSFRSTSVPSRWLGARYECAKKSAPSMGCLTSAMVTGNVIFLSANVMTVSLVPKQGILVPLAA